MRADLTGHGHPSPFWKIVKMALFTPGSNLKIFWAKSLHLKCYESALIPNNWQYNWNRLIFPNLFKNVLSFILGLILDAVLIEGPFMGDSIWIWSQIFELRARYCISKLSQYRWLVRYNLHYKLNYCKLKKIQAQNC